MNKNTEETMMDAYNLVKQYGGSVRKAAMALGMPYNTLADRYRAALDRMGLEDIRDMNRLTDEDLQQTVDAYDEHGAEWAASISLGISRSTFQARLGVAKRRGFISKNLRRE
jgi:hypothetical protein